MSRKVHIRRERWADGAEQGTCADCQAGGRPGQRLVKLTGRGPERRPRCRTCEEDRQTRQVALRASSTAKDDLGLTQEDRDAQKAAQRGLCWICGPWTGARGDQRDHDHRTGAFRGYLCETCNYWLLGRCLKDSVTMARRVVKYLEHPPAQDVLEGYHERDWSPYKGKLRKRS